MSQLDLTYDSVETQLREKYVLMTQDELRAYKKLVALTCAAVTVVFGVGIAASAWGAAKAAISSSTAMQVQKEIEQLSHRSTIDAAAIRDTLTDLPMLITTKDGANSMAINGDVVINGVLDIQDKERKTQITGSGIRIDGPERALFTVNTTETGNVRMNLSTNSKESYIAIETIGSDAMVQVNAANAVKHDLRLDSRLGLFEEPK